MLPNQPIPPHFCIQLPFLNYSIYPRANSQKPLTNVAKQHMSRLLEAGFLLQGPLRQVFASLA